MKTDYTVLFKKIVGTWQILVPDYVPGARGRARLIFCRCTGCLNVSKITLADVMVRFVKCKHCKIKVKIFKEKEKEEIKKQRKHQVRTFGKYYTAWGITKNVSEWACTLGITKQGLHYRLKTKSIDDALCQTKFKR